MDSPDVSRAALERLLTPPEGDRMELIVTYRRYDDYEAYEREIADLRQRYQRVQDEVYRWQLMGSRFLETFDEINRLEELLRRHHICMDSVLGQDVQQLQEGVACSRLNKIYILFNHDCTPKMPPLPAWSRE